jgi:hypothetical protein
VEDAVCVLGSQREARSRRRYTRQITWEYLSYLVKLRTQREQLEKRISELEEIEATCEQWLDLSHLTATKRHRRISELRRHARAQIHRAYNLMKRLAAVHGWDFCRLFVALCVALSSGSKTPVATANACLHLPHASFYRRYGKHVSQALRLAELWHNNPSSLDRAALLTHKPAKRRGSLDVEVAFDDWQRNVPEGKLYISDETNSSGQGQGV